MRAILFLVPCALLMLFSLSGEATATQDTLSRKTHVSVGVFVQQIDAIDTRSQSMECEIYLYLTWKGVHSPVGYEFVNGKNIEKIFEVTENAESGRNILSAKIRGTFMSSLDLSDYPTDKHVLRIELGDFNWPEDSLTYTVDTLDMGLSTDVALGEWRVSSIGPSLGKRYFAPNAHFCSHFEYALLIERESAPFVVKILIPLIIVVAMSMLTFYVPAAQLDPQVAIGTTSLLTIVAFHFLIRNQLPEVGYLTRADILIIGSYLMIFLSLVESVLVYTLSRKGHKKYPQQIDRLCRVIFPSSYAILVCVLWFA